MFKIYSSDEIGKSREDAIYITFEIEVKQEYMFLITTVRIVKEEDGNA